MNHKDKLRSMVACKKCGLDFPHGIYMHEKKCGGKNESLKEPAKEVVESLKEPLKESIESLKEPVKEKTKKVKKIPDNKTDMGVHIAPASPQGVVTPEEISESSNTWIYILALFGALFFAFILFSEQIMKFCGIIEDDKK